MNRRDILASLPAAAAVGILPVAAAGLATQAAAQGASESTWDKIMSTKVLRIGAALLEPWYFKDTTNSPAPGGVMVDGTMWRGLGTSYGNEVAKALGAKLEVVETTWGNAVAGLQTGQFDMMFAFDATPVRALAIDFVATPAGWATIALIGGENVEIPEWTDLNDPKYKVGLALGTSTADFVKSVAPKATFLEFQNSNEIFAAFQSGRTDVGVVTSPASDIARTRMGAGKTIVPKPAALLPVGVGIRNEADRRWASYLDTCTKYFYYSGTMQRMYEEVLSFRGADLATSVPIQRELWK